MAFALAEAGLEALVEVHDSAELERALSAGFPVVGVNARNLRTLQVDRALVESLGPKIPRGVIGVAESGVKSPEDLAALEAAGYHAFLVGEALITSKDPVALLQSWVGSVQ
jgi:indole-3-glycerol phosphate synthase